MFLRGKLVRLAYNNQDLRPYILPLLKSAAQDKALPLEQLRPVKWTTGGGLKAETLPPSRGQRNRDARRLGIPPNQVGYLWEWDFTGIGQRRQGGKWVAVDLEPKEIETVSTFSRQTKRPPWGITLRPAQRKFLELSAKENNLEVAALYEEARILQFDRRMTWPKAVRSAVTYMKSAFYRQRRESKSG
jgi:hypothetical protein